MDDLKIKILMQTFDKVTKPFQNILKSTEKLRSKLSKTKIELNKLNLAQKNLAKFKKIQTTLADNAFKLNMAKEKATQLTEKFKKTTNASFSLTASFKRANHMVEKLNQKHKKLIDSSNQLRFDLNQAKISTDNLARSDQKLNDRIMAVNKNLRAQGRELSNITKKTKMATKARNKLKSAMGASANTMISGAGTAYMGKNMLQGMGRIFLPGMEFGDQMTKMAAFAGIKKTSQDLKELQEVFENLGASTEHTATNIAMAGGVMAKAGKTAAEIKKAMPSMLGLASIGDLDLTQSTELGMAVIDGYRKSFKDLEPMTNIMAAASIKFKINMSDLKTVFEKVAPVAAIVALKFENLNAMVGLLGQSGVGSRVAGTGIKKILARLADPPTEALKALEKLQVKRTNKDGSLLPIDVILTSIKNATKKLPDIQQVAAFTKIAGLEALTTMSVLVEQSKKIKDLGIKLKSDQNVLKNLAKDTQDSILGDVTRMASAWDGLLIAIGGTTKSEQRDLLQNITIFINDIISFIKENKILVKNILKWAGIFAILITAFGGLTMAIGAILTPIALLSFAAAALSIGLAPILLAIGALIAITAVIIFYWSDLKEFFVNFWNEPLKATINYVSGVINLIIGMINFLQAPVRGFVNYLSEAFGGAKIMGEIPDIPKMEYNQITAGLNKNTAGEIIPTPNMAGQGNGGKTNQNQQNISISINAANANAAEIGEIIQQKLTDISYQRNFANQTAFAD